MLFIDHVYEIRCGDFVFYSVKEPVFERRKENELHIMITNHFGDYTFVPAEFPMTIALVKSDDDFVLEVMEKRSLYGHIEMVRGNH